VVLFSENRERSIVKLAPEKESWARVKVVIP
jgi:hypothetical protein